ncbi:IS200/IS605 family transposase [Paraglaciecola sp. 20A4]|uniref:IS200/IS605 family transposase n=1 Tax=Paraglaciecola sp. 20A4 TaxID=2687288 RepID=UPI0014094DD6|nr:IS200/IS605 family transposase [Paraglaciecola sp. 20A4]
MDYETKSHCKYLIALHLILVVKDRKPILKDRLGEFVKRIVSDIASRSDFDVEEIEIDLDHIHMLIRIGTKYSVGQYVRRIKQETTAKIWKMFPYLKHQFWVEKAFWSDGYFVCSVGNASAETIREYIREQG